MNRRKVGLSKAQKPSPLLKQVNGRERKTGPSSKTEDIFAPPESSSDEEELEETPNDAISSSEDDLSRSADIFTTKFITRPVGKNRGKYGRKSRPQSGGETVESPPLRRSKRQRRGAEDIEDEESVEAAVGDSKTANDGSRGDQSTDSASHPSNRLPWAPGHKVIRTFSARDKNRPVKEAASLVQRETAIPKAPVFKLPPPIPSSPKKSRTVVDSDGESELTSPDSDSSDPMPQPRSRGTKRTVQKQSSDAESTLRAPSFKLPRELDQDPSSVEPSSAKPLFRVPISERSFATRGDKPSRSSPERDDSQLMATFGGVDDDEPEAGKPVEQAMCPFCDEPVDAGFLKEHTKSRMTMAMATRFCREHKKQSARETWKSRNYPTIDWDSLSARVARHDDLVSRLLEQGSRSFYRDLLAENVKAGRNRTLLKTAVSESIIPGYFGPRGLRVMSESITSRFSSALRDSAIRDRLISARGHGVFVGQVLVPEVAVRLIMEDMGVSEEMARDVLQESSEIGELLNEDLGDHIADDHHRGDDVEEGY